MTLAHTTTNVKDRYLKNDGAKPKSWMIEEILLLLENHSSSTYSSIQRDIQRKIREAKQKGSLAEQIQ